MIRTDSKIKKDLKVQIELNVGTLPNSRTRIDCFILEPEFDRLTLSYPEDKMEYAPYLTEGTEIRVFVYSLSGILIVDSIVYDEPSEGKIVIEFNEEHRTIQRRKYERQSYSTDLYVERPEGNIKMSTIDISGGGIRFCSKYEFKPMQTIDAMFRLVSFEPMIKIQGVILKKDYFSENEYVLEFTQIDEFDREKIIKKCDELKKQSKDW